MGSERDSGRTAGASGDVRRPFAIGEYRGDLSRSRMRASRRRVRRLCRAIKAGAGRPAGDQRRLGRCTRLRQVAGRDETAGTADCRARRSGNMPPAPAPRPNYALPAPDGSDDIAGKALANCADCGSEWDGRQTAPVGKLSGQRLGIARYARQRVGSGSRTAGMTATMMRRMTAGHGARRMAATAVFVCCAAGPGTAIRTVARSADRDRVDPDNRNNVIGFRVVCSSPSSDTDP